LYSRKERLSCMFTMRYVYTLGKVTLSLVQVAPMRVVLCKCKVLMVLLLGDVFLVGMFSND